MDGSLAINENSKKRGDINQAITNAPKGSGSLHGTLQRPHQPPPTSSGAKIDR